MTTRIIGPLVVLLALLLALAPGPVAAGATTTTTTTHKETISQADVNPCTGDPGVVTITYNAVEHVTELPDGTFHATFTQTGTFVFVPDDSSLPTYTGHFTVWGGFNLNRQNTASTFTFSVRGVGSDGSRLLFTLVEHFNLSADGHLVNEFSKMRCG